MNSEDIGIEGVDLEAFMREVKPNPELLKRYGSKPFGRDDKIIIDVLFACGAPKSVVAMTMGFNDGQDFPIIRPSVAAQMTPDKKRKLGEVFRLYGGAFPPGIWNCCSEGCFADLVTDKRNPALLEEVWGIHAIAKDLHKRIDLVNELVPTRGRDIGGSIVGFYVPERSKREENVDFDHQRALGRLVLFANEVLPFLYGKIDAPTGTPRPKRELCSEAICCLLGVSRNFLYKRNRTAIQPGATVQDLLSIVNATEDLIAISTVPEKNGRRDKCSVCAKCARPAVAKSDARA